MINRKVLLILISMSVSPDTLLASENPQPVWQEAVGLYTMETEDYLSTVTDSLKEIRYWREKVLQEKFVAHSSEVEGLLAKGNASSLDEIETYVVKNGIDKLDDVALMHIAQLHYQKSSYEISRDMKKYQKEVETYQEGQRDTPPELPVPDYTKAEFYAGELLIKYKQSPLGDNALYLIGYCFYDEGSSEMASKTYELLLKNYPNSKLVPEVKWRLAENYFDSQSFEAAYALYKSLADSKTKFSEASLYKQGGILFSTGRFTEAAPVFMRVYKESFLKLDSANPQTQTLYDESIDYLARLKGKGFNIRSDEDTDAIITQRLGEIYKRSELRNLERQTYLTFVSQHPQSKSSPRFMDRVIDSHTSDAQLGRAQEVRNKFVAALSSSSVFWAKYKNDINTTVETQDLFEKHLLASADFYGEQAKRTKRKADYNAAVRFFQKFINEYQSSPLYSEANFNLAELNYAFGDYSEAANHYLNALNQDESGTYQEDGSYGYLISQAKVLHFSLKDDMPLLPARKSDGSLAKASNPNSEETHFLEAASVYVKTSTSATKRQKVLYRVAEIYFRHNQFAKTRQALELLNSGNETTIVTAAASQMLAATYDLENNLSLALSKDRDLTLVTETDQDSKNSNYAVASSDRSELVEAASLLKNRQYGEAAQIYESFVKKNPDYIESKLALFKAGIYYRKAIEFSASQRAFDQFIKLFPNDQLRPEVEFLKIANEVSILKFSEAAKEYVTFAEKFPQHPLATQSYMNAAYLERATLHFKEAAVNYEKFAARGHDDEVWFKVLSYYKKTNDLKSTERILKKFSSPKVGRDFYLRALFEDASIERTHILKNCRILSAASKRYNNALTAQSRHAISGCSYLKTWTLRDDLINVDFKNASSHEKITQAIRDFEAKSVTLIELGHTVEETHDKIWLAYLNLDLGTLFTNASKNIGPLNTDQAIEWRDVALKYDQNAFRLFEVSQLLEVAPESVSRLKRAAALDISSRDITWPLLANMSLAIKNGASTSEAIKFADLSQWAKARENLLVCVEKTIDPSCAASLLNLGYRGGRQQYLIDILKKVSSPSSFTLLALAKVYTFDESHISDALNLIKQVAVEDTKNPLAYSLASQIYQNSNQYDLAYATLMQGLVNTDDDENLLLAKGYLDLLTNQKQNVLSLISDYASLTESNPQFRIFAGNAHQIFGDAKVTITGVGPDFDMARFALALQQKDAPTLETMEPLLKSITQDFAHAGYLLGLYYQSQKQDPQSAQKYFEQAKQAGEWSQWLEISLSLTANGRYPAFDERKPQ
jgi:tetratricopeptide (TPR) repeat protein